MYVLLAIGIGYSYKTLDHLPSAVCVQCIYVYVCILCNCMYMYLYLFTV